MLLDWLVGISSLFGHDLQLRYTPDVHAWQDVHATCALSEMTSSS